MDDEEETYRLWKIRKTIMQVSSALGERGESEPRSPRRAGHAAAGARTAGARPGGRNEPPHPRPRGWSGRVGLRRGPRGGGLRGTESRVQEPPGRGQGLARAGEREDGRR